MWNKTRSHHTSAFCRWEFLLEHLVSRRTCPWGKVQPKPSQLCTKSYESRCHARCSESAPSSLIPHYFLWQLCKSNHGPWKSNKVFRFLFISIKILLAEIDSGHDVATPDVNSSAKSDTDSWGMIPAEIHTATSDRPASEQVSCQVFSSPSPPPFPVVSDNRGRLVCGIPCLFTSLMNTFQCSPDRKDLHPRLSLWSSKCKSKPLIHELELWASAWVSHALTGRAWWQSFLCDIKY